MLQMLFPAHSFLIFFFYSFCWLYIEPCHFIACLQPFFQMFSSLTECCILINFLSYLPVNPTISSLLVCPSILFNNLMSVSFISLPLFKSVSSFSNLFHRILLFPCHFYSFIYLSVFAYQYDLSACPTAPKFLEDDFSICCICWLSFEVDSFFGV